MCVWGCVYLKKLLLKSKKKNNGLPRLERKKKELNLKQKQVKSNLIPFPRIRFI